MDDDAPPQPGLWLRMNALVHVVLIPLLVGFVYLILLRYASWVGPGAIMVFILIVMVPAGGLALGYFLVAYRKSAGAAAILGAVYCLVGISVGALIPVMLGLVLTSPGAYRSLPAFGILLGVTSYCLVNAALCWRWVSRLEHWRHEERFRCPACGYNLRGLDPARSPTCPECGQAILTALMGRPAKDSPLEP